MSERKSRSRRKNKGVIVDRNYIESKLAEVIEDIDNNEDNCIEYNFLPPEIAATIDSTNNYKNMNDEKFIPYNNWIEATFFKPDDKANLSKTETHIRKVIKNSKKYFESGLHREFSSSGYGEDYIYNILCYFKTENCKSADCGLGLVYVDKNKKLKKVNLPVIDGLTLKIRDKCFYHYTPELHPIDDSKPVVRIIIRDYYRLGPITFENSLLNTHLNALSTLDNNNAAKRKANKTKTINNRLKANTVLENANLSSFFNQKN